MDKFKEVQVTQLRVCATTCNKCGRVVDFGEADFQVEIDFTPIRHTYQYGSPKEGSKYVSHVCEPCMDAFYATFVIAPQVINTIIWGEEPDDPIVLSDLEQSTV